MVNEVKQLLSQVVTIESKYNQIAKATGDYYNLFEILRIEEKEVKHSAFIADLLDVEGYHSQDDTFLRLFVRVLKKLDKIPKDFPEFNYSNVKTETEKNIGPITDDEGGRIDILIYDYTTAIIIENKIYAPVQPKQITRYRNYAKRFNNFRILYLNLDGRAPQNQEGVPDAIITYQEVILPWLQECIKECTSKPKIRESIAQYIQTIKYLSGMSTNNEKNIEIGRLIASSEDYRKAAHDIINSVNYANAFIQFEYWNNMRIKLSSLTFDNISYDVTFEKVLKSYTEHISYGIKILLATVNDKYEIILWVGLDGDKIPFHSYLLYDKKTSNEVQKDEMLSRNDESAIIQKLFYELLPYENQWYWEYLSPEFKITNTLDHYSKAQNIKIIEEHFNQIEKILRRFDEKFNSLFPGSVNPNLRLTQIAMPIV